MKRVQYRFHPSDYDLGASEQFYGDMEAKGWRLAARGRYLSKFVPVEPSRARYRIEVCTPEFPDTDSELSEGQQAVFEDCGWEYITYHGPLHVFRAPAGSRAPEFYSDPRQQAETLKKMRRGALWCWLPAALLVAFILFLESIPQNGLIRAGAEFQVKLVTLPAIYLLLFSFLLWSVYTSIRDAWLITRTYRRLKKGIPLDHAPKRRRLHRWITGALWGMTALSVLLAAAQLLGTRTYPLPAQADGPYLLLRDLGHEGERTTFMDRDSKVTCTRSLLADYWDTVEYLDTGADHCWIYQDIYRLRDGRMAMGLARALLETATFGGNFTPVQTEGLDAAWTTHGMEVVAVKGNMAAYITYLGGSYDNFDPQAICAALAEVWADTAD